MSTLSWGLLGGKHSGAGLRYDQGPRYDDDAGNDTREAFMRGTSSPTLLAPSLPPSRVCFRKRTESARSQEYELEARGKNWRSEADLSEHGVPLVANEGGIKTALKATVPVVTERAHRWAMVLRNDQNVDALLRSVLLVAGCREGKVSASLPQSTCAGLQGKAWQLVQERRDQTSSRINFMERFLVLWAMSLWGEDLPRLTVVYITGDTPTKGKSEQWKCTPDFRKRLRRIFQQCVKFDARFIVEWAPSKEKQFADAPSRNDTGLFFELHREWTLAPTDSVTLGSYDAELGERPPNRHVAAKLYHRPTRGTGRGAKWEQENWLNWWEYQYIVETEKECPTCYDPSDDAEDDEHATSTTEQSVQVVRQILHRHGYTNVLSGVYGTSCDGKNEKDWNKACHATFENVRLSKAFVFDDSLTEVASSLESSATKLFKMDEGSETPWDNVSFDTLAPNTEVPSAEAEAGDGIPGLSQHDSATGKAFELLGGPEFTTGAMLKATGSSDPASIISQLIRNLQAIVSMIYLVKAGSARLSPLCALAWCHAENLRTRPVTDSGLPSPTMRKANITPEKRNSFSRTGIMLRGSVRLMGKDRMVAGASFWRWFVGFDKYARPCTSNEGKRANHAGSCIRQDDTSSDLNIREDSLGGVAVDLMRYAKTGWEGLALT
ncbi:hypothetical protein CYMTET_53896 [Cymbomonas tetramitiformis]|uniref:Uncharacterized protein n=1 Tax=Cymbomonas tetramitiformis TaxID=36881 RepID=A0AAE0BH81_9CHLO|nr:hypothetical protein CYMTET_53896 [Cymbomonas tetramitiformis]